MAGELKRLVDTVRFGWVGDVVKSFKFEDFRKGLEWFAAAQCPMCLNGGGAPCENRKCASGKKLDQLYKLAWVRGLKTTYYLRSIGATHVEKNDTQSEADNAPKVCSILDPECEACQ